MKMKRPKRLELSNLMVHKKWHKHQPTFELLLDAVTTFKLMLEPIREFAEENELWNDTGKEKDLVSLDARDRSATLSFAWMFEAKPLSGINPAGTGADYSMFRPALTERPQTGKAGLVLKFLNLK